VLNTKLNNLYTYHGDVSYCGRLRCQTLHILIVSRLNQKYMPWQIAYSHNKVAGNGFLRMLRNFLVTLWF